MGSGSVEVSMPAPVPGRRWMALPAGRFGKALPGRLHDYMNSLMAKCSQSGFGRVFPFMPIGQEGLRAAAQWTRLDVS